MSETSEKICTTIFQVKISVQNIFFSSSKHKNSWSFSTLCRKKSYLEEKLVELFGEVAIPFAFFFASVSCEG